MTKNCILIIDDDTAIGNLEEEVLQKAGYDTERAYSGTEALLWLREHRPALVLLDLMLPGLSGEDVLKEISAIPVIVVSAKAAAEDRVALLTGGAVDYLTKPFHLEELAARIRCLTLRRFTQSDVVLTCGNLTFDTKTRQAAVAGDPLSLTKKETGILEYLMLNQGRPVSQEELIEHVWDSSVNNFSNSIRVHMSSLRKKLRAAQGFDSIHNRIGEGYVMEVSA